MYVKKNRLILMHQTHSNKVIEISNANLRKKIISDAMITRHKKIALGVLTADCVPILIYDKKNEIIGCIHAGWKGALSGIIKKTINKIKKKNYNYEIIASIGPCISSKSYEVNLGFYRKFLAKAKKNKKYFLKAGESISANIILEDRPVIFVFSDIFETTWDKIKTIKSSN